MIRITDSHPIIYDTVMYVEYAGKSTDQKPTKFGESMRIVNGERIMEDISISTGSVFVEVDTGEIYMFDETNKTWEKVGG